MTVSWLLLAVAIAAGMAGQVLLKLGAGRADFLAQLLDWHTLGGLLLYGVSAMFYIVALRRIPISVALPSTAFSYIVIALIGHYGFGEPLPPGRAAGIALIAGGVALLASSH